MAETRRRQDWSRPPRSLAVALRESGILVVSSKNSAGYEHAGLRPEPHKGTPRIGSGTAERRTPPERENPPSREGRAAGTRRRPRLRRGENVEARVSRRECRGLSNAAAAAKDGVCPRRGSRPSETTQKDPLMSIGKPSWPIGTRETRPREGAETDVGSAPRSRQASLGDGQTLVKAGLRPPPPAASALTRVWPSPLSAAREIEGQEWASTWLPSARRRPHGAKKKRGALLTEKSPYEPGHDDADVVILARRPSCR
jgi:hypothetical protein